MPEYKYGKIEKTMDLELLHKLMERVPKVDLRGFPAEFIQAIIALFYWTGLRRSEVLGDTGHKWKLQSGEIRRSEPFPGLLKENLWVDEEFLYVRQIARKHGKREEPQAIPLVLPYVNLIVEQWKHTSPNERVFRIPYVTFWRILKRVDPKIYPHFFVLNRVTKLASDPETSMAEIVAWTGKHPKTVGSYMARSGRFSRKVGRRLLREK